MTTYIHGNGQWDSITLGDPGAVRITLSSDSPARLEVTGLIGKAQVLDARTQQRIILPPNAFGAEQVSVHAIAGEGVRVGALVHLNIARGAIDQHRFTDIPLLGSSTELLRIDSSGGSLILSPAPSSPAGTAASAGAAAGAVAAERAHEGLTSSPTVTSLLIDTSASMQGRQQEVESICRYVEDLSTRAGAPLPQRITPRVGAVSAPGFGEPTTAGAQGDRPVLITDLPVAQEGIDCLVLCEQEVLDAFTHQNDRFYAVTPEQCSALNDPEAEQRYAASVLDALTDWLCRPAIGEPR